jgi:hypothetical protein
MVRVSQTMPGGEMVRTYLSRGDYFGEIGLLRSIKRIATCAALDAVDVVRIPASEFNLMLERFPGVRAQLEPVAEARMIATKNQTAPPGLGLDDFLNQGLFEAQNLLLIDLDNCTRCRCLCAGVRKSARWCFPLTPRRFALRSFFGRYGLSILPRSTLHDPVSGRLHPAKRESGDHHRRLVHRLWKMCGAMSVRKHQHASAGSGQEVRT